MVRIRKDIIFTERKLKQITQVCSDPPETSGEARGVPGMFMSRAKAVTMKESQQSMNFDCLAVLTVLQTERQTDGIVVRRIPVYQYSSLRIFTMRARYIHCVPKKRKPPNFWQ